MWLLFPLGVAVNRLLKRDGQINQAWRKRLDEMFGTPDWYTEFYEKRTEEGLFDQLEEVRKSVNVDTIGKYFVRRLKTAFAYVLDDPLTLYNSCNCPLYLLCFGCGNKKGAPIAKRIARHIVEQ